MFLSAESPLPSLSSSPVSSEAPDSPDPSPAVSYNSYNKKYVRRITFELMSPPAAYKPLTGYATQESNPDYAVHLNTMTSLTSTFADCAPFGTAPPSVTSALAGEDTLVYPQPQPTLKALGSADYSPSGESKVGDENNRDCEEPPNRKKTHSARMSHAHPYLKPAPKPERIERRPTGLSRGREGFVDRSVRCRVKGCNKLFITAGHRERHILSDHPEERRETSHNLPGTLLLTAHFVHLAFVCDCGDSFKMEHILFAHMRVEGCAVWHSDGTWEYRTKDWMQQRRAKDNAASREEAKDYVKQIMACAKKAQDKRDRQAQSGF